MRVMRGEIVVRRSALGDWLIEVLNSVLRVRGQRQYGEIRPVGATWRRPRMTVAFYCLWLVIMGIAFVSLVPWILNVLLPG